MMNNSTIEALRTMRFSAMAAEFERQLNDPAAYSQLGFEERFALMVDSEWNRRQQNKLVRCVRGAVLDVAVDLRPESATYGQWTAVELSAENKRQFLIPRRFGHGFVTLTDEVEFLYKADNFYAPAADGGILWNDPELGIDWGVAAPVLSQKDQALPLWKDAITEF
ncbi:MAG: dTDP-4-dehydrorhamnose 3,5-epimerase family protein [Oscillospiraceae bacterium]|nr:dTDP-4-dehydrorhamnose 3,5-epimerase family protein [Oscillospiraceae bacterium]